MESLRVSVFAPYYCSPLSFMPVKFIGAMSVAQTGRSPGPQFVTSKWIRAPYFMAARFVRIGMFANMLLCKAGREGSEMPLKRMKKRSEKEASTT